jgi:hypothetical protein
MNRFQLSACALMLFTGVPAIAQDFEQDWKLQGEKAKLAAQAWKMAPIAPKSPMPPVAPFFFQGNKRRTRDDERLYSSGTRALDNSRWEDAVKYFTEAADQKGSRADGALYWKAYAENKLGQRDTALATIAALRKDYASSRWLGDAQALELEIKQQSGKPVSPADASNDELKMLALNGLLHSDPEQAVPIVDKLLRSNNSPKLKNEALFVLTQSKSPKAQQLLNDAAKGAYNPDIQIKAIRQIATSGGKEGRANLYTIYSGTNDLEVKKEIVRMFITSSFTGPSDPLVSIAKSEKNVDLRREAIRTIGVSNASQTGDILITLYPAEQDPEAKKEIVNGLFIQHNAKGIVDLARKETNPEMKQELVQKLSVMHSKEATAFLMEILSK